MSSFNTHNGQDLPADVYPKRVLRCGARALSALTLLAALSTSSAALAQNAPGAPAAVSPPATATPSSAAATPPSAAPPAAGTPSAPPAAEKGVPRGDDAVSVRTTPSAAAADGVTVSRASVELEARLQRMLKGGGLTAHVAGVRAVNNSSQVAAKKRALEATEADLSETRGAFVPSLSLSARYTRLSPIDLPALASFGDGSLVVSATPSTAPRPLGQNEVLLATPVPSFSFPVFLNQYVFSASLNVPVSDYVLRMSRAVQGASRSRQGAELAERATRRSVARDAEVAYYQWIRAQGVQIVAAQSLEQAVGHAQDTKNSFAAGMASRADVLRSEGQLEMTKLFLQRAESQVMLATSQLSVAMGDPLGTHYEVGENVLQSQPRPAGVDDEQAALREAESKRLELKALTANEQALLDGAELVQIGNYPRLDAQANAQYSNPNQRYFPQTDEFKATWDVGVVLSWTPTGMFSNNAKAESLRAHAAELSAQRSQLMDGLKLEVTRSRRAVIDAEFAVSVSEQTLAAAEEGYRVRRELFRAGRATQVEVTDAETELLRSRLEAVNAHIDLSIARVEFAHTLGRDAAN